MEKIFRFLFPQHRFIDDYARRSYLAGFTTMWSLLFALSLLPLAYRHYVMFENPTWFIGVCILLVITLIAIVLVRKSYLTLGILLLVFCSSLITVVPSILEVNSLSYAGFFLAQNMLIVSITLKPRYIGLVYLLNIGLLLFGAWHVQWHGPSHLDYAILDRLLWRAFTFNTVVLIFTFLAAISASTFLRGIEQNRQEISTQLQLLEQQKHALEDRIALRTTELHQALEQVNLQAQEQEALLSEKQRQQDNIRSMRIPIIPLNGQTMIMPLVGELDSERMQLFHNQALLALQKSRSRHLLIDISGVPYVDQGMALGLIEIVKSARLIGSEVVLVGMRPEVAHILTQMRVSINSIQVFANLQAALEDLKQSSLGRSVLPTAKALRV